MKNPKPPRPCKHCGIAGTHLEFTCFKKPKQTTIKMYYKASKVTTKPRKPLNPKGKQFKAWMVTREKWLEQHKAAYFWCHYCAKQLTRSQLTLDHMEARSRRPDLRHVLSNLVPCCYTCNALKGSLSHDEYSHTCA